VRVLVIEDFEPLARSLAQGLREAGYAVDTSGDGEEGLALGEASPYDAILLDLMVPKLDGFEILRRLRARGSKTAVLVLSARDQLPDRVAALDLGADDYLVKPFHFPELLARVRALLKRGQPASTDLSLRVADLEIDPVRHRATRSGQRIDLTAKEFALLTLLAQRTGDVLSRTQIASLVWDIHFDSDTNLIDVAVRRLRAKVDDPFADKLIHTVRGVGYVLEARLVP
jgi:two-component system, OmpR family, copper resistance phosphate regulon response regulator CusR